jgi:hypothetical protein
VAGTRVLRPPGEAHSRKKRTRHTLANCGQVARPKRVVGAGQRRIELHDRAQRESPVALPTPPGHSHPEVHDSSNSLFCGFLPLRRITRVRSSRPPDPAARAPPTPCPHDTPAEGVTGHAAVPRVSQAPDSDYRYSPQAKDPWRTPVGFKRTAHRRAARWSAAGGLFGGLRARQQSSDAARTGVTSAAGRPAPCRQGLHPLAVPQAGQSRYAAKRLAAHPHLVSQVAAQGDAGPRGSATEPRSQREAQAATRPSVVTGSLSCTQPVSLQRREEL